MSEETAAQPGGTTPDSPGAGASASVEPKAAGASSASNPACASPPSDERGESDESDDVADGLAADDAGDPDAPKRKRRRRRRRKKPAQGDATEGSTIEAGVNAAPDSTTSSASTNASDPVAASLANLAGGLFSHLDDREIPCRLDGCTRTWVWTADEQIRNFGQPPPRRVCSEHAARLDSVTDMAIPCANPGCEKTWLWTRGARAAQLQRGGLDKAPQRVCDDCLAEEKTLADREAPCKVDGCRRTWTWSRDAQLKHRAWLRHTGGELEATERGPTAKGSKRPRRRKRARGSVFEPPARMCEPCRAKLARLGEREGPCKVHGCTRMAKVDRDTQLRAWAGLHTEDLDVEAPSLPRRMCEVCREFCKHHPDREVACGRPSCEKTWTFKTGAQLQAFLAGRLEDPVRLCEECSAGDFVALERPVGAPAGAEVMPCVMLGCEGVWYWLPGTQLSVADPGSTPADRMCAEHRAGLGAEAPRAAQTASPRAAVAESGTEADSSV